MNTTIIKLYNLILDKNHENTFNFKSIADQKQWFLLNASQSLETDTFSYIRKNTPVRVPLTYEQARQYNYLSYVNETNGKTYYNFIDNVKYINPNVSEYEITTDVFQTYLFDYKIKDMFLERGHVNRWKNNEQYPDTIVDPVYYHTLENFDIGKSYDIIDDMELDTNKVPVLDLYDDKNINMLWYYVFATEKIGSDGIKNEHGFFIYGLPVPFSKQYKGSEIYFNNFYVLESTPDHIKKQISTNPNFLNSLPQVHSIFISPFAPYKNLVYNYEKNGNLISVTISGPTSSYLKVSTYEGQNFLNVTPSPYVIECDNLPLYSRQKIAFSKDGVYNEFSESVAHTYPYEFDRISNGSEYADVHAQNGKNAKIEMCPTFDVMNNITLRLKNYNSDNDIINRNDYNDFLDANERPLMTDKWLQYESQNKASLRSGIMTKVAFTGANIGLGLLTGGLGLAVAGSQALSTAETIADELIKRQDIKESPDEIRTTGGYSMLNKIKNNYKFYISHYQIKDIIKKRLCNFWHRFGYLVNDYYNGNVINTRYRFNFVKAKNISIENINAIPEDDKNELIAIYQKGVRVWHYRKNNNNFNNPYVLDFSKANDEVFIVGE